MSINSLTPPVSLPKPEDTGDRDEHQNNNQPKHRDMFGMVTRFPTLTATLPLYSWAWFLMPMTTLGLSTLINAQLSSHNFDGLYALGLIVYFIGFAQFAFVVLAKITRFTVIKGSLRKSLLAPDEALFSAAFWICLYGVITGGIDFAAPSPGSTLSLMFLSLYWIYMVFALLASLALHLLLFHRGFLEDKGTTPAWLLPILPVILIGVCAGSVVEAVNHKEGYPVVFIGLLCSSSGLLLSISMMALYLHRLLVSGLPPADTRPAMMIAVGPPTYAPLAFLKMATVLDSDTALMIIAYISTAIWGLGAFLFLMAAAAILRRARSMSFHLTWYGLVFPNVGLLSALDYIGRYLGSDNISWVACIGTILLTGVWLFVTVCHVRAIVLKSPYLW